MTIISSKHEAQADNELERKNCLRQRWESSVKCLVHELSKNKFQVSDSNGDKIEVASDGADGADAIPNAINNIIKANKVSIDDITTLSDSWFEKVVTLYSEDHRAYHNLRHVDDVLTSLDFLMADSDRGDNLSTNKQTGKQRQATQQHDDVISTITTMAAFFHDAIYNPRSSTNEKDSADLFIEFASQLLDALQCDNATTVANKTGSPSEKQVLSSTVREFSILTEIEGCILATASHISSAKEAYHSGKTLLAAFLDADMSILGKEEDFYNQYAGAIRKEYQFVEREVYCEKRSDILESFLPLTDAPTESTTSMTDGAKDQKCKLHEYIYATEKGRKCWENQARLNLKSEIHLLRQGIIPGENES